LKRHEEVKKLLDTGYWISNRYKMYSSIL